MYAKRNYGLSPRALGGFFEDVMQHGFNKFEENNWASVPVNIHETDKSYELGVIAPGLKKEDLKINVDKNILTISFEQKEEKKEQEGSKVLRSEYSFRSFKRSFTLTEKIDAAQISAKYADGVLYVTLPKKENVEQTAQEISVA